VRHHPDLTGQEATAAQTIGLELQLLLFDAVFHVAPQHVDIVIDELRVANQVVSDREALVAPRRVYSTSAMMQQGLAGFRLVAEEVKSHSFPPMYCHCCCAFAKSGAVLARTRYLIFLILIRLN
jgi:hypothetical protein